MTLWLTTERHPLTLDPESKQISEEEDCIQITARPVDGSRGPWNDVRYSTEEGCDGESGARRWRRRWVKTSRSGRTNSPTVKYREGTQAMINPETKIYDQGKVRGESLDHNLVRKFLKIVINEFHGSRGKKMTGWRPA